MTDVARRLSRANISYRDQQDRVFDFHALLHQFISSLAEAGVHPKVAQQLARHSKITLTMDHNTHMEVATVAPALNKLPALPSNDLVVHMVTQNPNVGGRTEFHGGNGTEEGEREVIAAKCLPVNDLKPADRV